MAISCREEPTVDQVEKNVDGGNDVITFRGFYNMRKEGTIGESLQRTFSAHHRDGSKSGIFNVRNLTTTMRRK